MARWSGERAIRPIARRSTQGLTRVQVNNGARTLTPKHDGDCEDRRRSIVDRAPREMNQTPRILERQFAVEALELDLRLAEATCAWFPPTVPLGRVYALGRVY